MSFMATYKVGQGRQARTFAAVSAVLVIAWGCYAFLEYGNTKLDRLLGLSKPFFGRPLMGADSAVTGWLTPSFVVAAVAFLGLMFWVRRFLNRPKLADHLIGTELEMRRVKWPTRETTMRSGAMVVYYTFWLALIILILDLLMATFVGALIGKEAGSEGIGRIIKGIADTFSGS